MKVARFSSCEAPWVEEPAHVRCTDAMSNDDHEPKKPATAHTIKAPVELTAPLLEVLRDEPLLNLHAIALECLRFGVAELAKDRPRLVAMVRAEMARRRSTLGRPGA